MLVEASLLKDQILKKITTPHGAVYFFKNFFITEFNEGTTVTIDVIKPIHKELEAFYGCMSNTAYIANRHYSYSVNPLDYLHYFKQGRTILSMAVVAHTNIGLSNVLLESIFVKCKIKKFNSLVMATSWSTNNVKNLVDGIPGGLPHIA